MGGGVEGGFHAPLEEVLQTKPQPWTFITMSYDFQNQNFIWTLKKFSPMYFVNVSIQ